MPVTPQNQPPCPDHSGRCLCQRLGRELTSEEYKLCPYRCSELPTAAEGKLIHLCDFVSGRDPVAFGFPVDLSRHRYA